MSGVDRGIVIRQLDRLWSHGSLTGLGEAQLLERYRRAHDESAFEALVDRHGPMVLGLCRRMLRDPRDIEDAFQATFLVLVRKASGIRDGALLANWLYGVAYRVACRARRTRLRRGDREVSLELLSQPPATRSTQALLSEVGPALDEELARLPDKYRAPIVLCYLNGKTHEQIAELLNCPVGTIHTRITRGRDMLRGRLTRRGFAPTAAIMGFSPSWSIPFTAETVPPSLIFATMNAVGQIGSSHAIKAGLIASSVLSLTQGAITSMNFATWKWASLGLMAAAVSASGVVDPIVLPPQAPVKPTTNDASTVTKATRPQSNTPVNADPLKPTPDPAGNFFDPRFRPTDGTTNLNLGLVQLQLEQLLQYVEKTPLSNATSAESRHQIAHYATVLDGMLADLNEELERFEVQRKVKVFELMVAKANAKKAELPYENAKMLFEKKPPTVSANEVGIYEGELNIARFKASVAEANLGEPQLRIAQLTPKKERLQTLLNRAMKTLKQPEGASSPAKPR